MHRPTALVLALLAATVVSGCDNNLAFSIFRSTLADLRAGGGRYHQATPAPQCTVDDSRLDIGLLPLVTTRDRLDALLEPGTLLDDCTLALAEGQPDRGRVCHLGADDVEITNPRVQLTELGGAPACCGDTCAAPEAAGDCAALGGGWTCNAEQATCERALPLAPLALDWVPVGSGGAGRAVALVLDNSGTLAGRGEDGIPVPSRATDGTDARIAAAIDLVQSLSPGEDRVGVYTFDGAGSSGVTSRTAENLGLESTLGFSGDLRATAGTLRELANAEGTGSGSPVYDAVVRVAADLRDVRAAAGRNASIVLFADGAPELSSASQDEAVAAAVGDPATDADDLPVFVVHLDNPRAGTPPTGRLPGYEALACASSGAYLHLQDPGGLGEVFLRQLPFLTRGHYRLTTSYEQLRLDAGFPGDACYAVATDLALTVEGRTKTLPLDRRVGADGIAEPDHRLHVCKR